MTKCEMFDRKGELTYRKSAEARAYMDWFM